MLGHGTTLTITHRLGVLAALALTLAPAPWVQQARAGTLEKLEFQARTLNSAVRVSPCAAMARTPSCRAALDTSLRAAAQAIALKGRPDEERGFYASGRLSAASESHEPLPLKFNMDPEWKKHAKVLAREGLTLLRVPQGVGHEFVVGINRHGMLGFSLKDTTGE